MRLFAVGILTSALLACAGGSVRCGTQGFATLDLGDALLRVRQARVFADDQGRRLALAELESLLISAVEADPDPDDREAAWRWADSERALETAEETLRRMEQFESEFPPGPERAEARRTERYRYYTGLAAGLIHFRSVDECARDTWTRIYESALRANAL